MRCRVFCFICFFSPIIVWAAQAPVEAAKQGFSQRWEEVHGDTKSFPLWTPGWKEEELKERYDQLCRERERAYGDFRKKEGHKEFGNRAAFAYNEACPGYDASIVLLGGKTFVAMHAPTKQNEKEFFDLLRQYAVTDLVRLTPWMERGCERTVPYWDGRTNINPRTWRPTIVDDGREMNYVMTDLWGDQQGIEPGRLIALVKAVMSSADPCQVVAVHCHGGVGRTGTFLSAYRLIQEIDAQRARGIPADQIQVSVDRAIWEVALQRIYGIGSFSQYLSLHQLVGAYLQML